MVNSYLRSMIRKIAAALALVLPLLLLTSPVYAALIIVDGFGGAYLGTRTVVLTNNGGLSTMPSFTESGGIGTIVLPSDNNSLTQVIMTYNWGIPRDFTDGGLNTQFFFQFDSTDHNYAESWKNVGGVMIRALTRVGGNPVWSNSPGIGVGVQNSPHLFTYPFSSFSGSFDFSQVLGLEITFTSTGTWQGVGTRGIFRMDSIRGTPDGGSPPLPPYATISLAPTQGSPDATGPIDFRVEFTSPVFGFTVDDIVLGGTAGPTTKSVTGSGSIYTVSVNGMASHGTVTIGVPANTVVDSWDQNNSASTGSPSVLYGTPPAITSSPPGGTVNSGYNFQYATTGDPTITFTRTSGTFPDGLSMNNSGALTGTPSRAGTFTGQVQASSPYGAATQDFTIVIGCPTFSILPASLTTTSAAVFYSQALSVSSEIGAGSVTYTVPPGSLPSGLTLSGTGTLNGTPLVSGTFDFTVTATHASTCTTTRAYTMTVNPPVIALSPSTTLNGTAGVSFTQAFGASGGNGTYTYTMTGGALPTGVTFNAGTISGTPRASGSFSFDITASDQTTPVGSGSRTYSLTIAPPNIVVDPPTLASGTVASPYSASVSASGGNGSYTYAITSGALPSGITLDGATGVLSGTTTSSGSFTFDVTASDETSPAGSGKRSYTLVIAPPIITVNPASLTSATAGTSYSQSFTASGGVGTYTYALTNGTLPTGLTFDASSATISGTPTASGTFTFDVTATDQTTPPATGSRTYTLTVVPPTLNISPATLTTGIAGQPYSQTVSASGGIGSHTLNITGGALPAGLLFDGTTISGTPTASGTFNFQITANDQTVPPASAVQNYSLVIDPATLTMSPASLADATAGFAYTANLTGLAGVLPYAFAVTGGALPPGITLAADGTLSGTTLSNGTFTFDVTMTDSTVPAASVIATYSLTVNLPVLGIAPSSLPGAVLETAYSLTFIGQFGVAPYTFSTLDVLPPGFSLDPSGVLSGMPTLEGVYSFTITVGDVTGATTSTLYSLAVTLAPAIITEPPPPLPCPDYNFQSESVVRSVTADQSMALGCNILFENGQPVQWLGGSVTSSGNIGVQSVIDRGVLQAVDVFLSGPNAQFTGDAAVCLKGSGAMVFLAASGVPRTPQDLIAWQTPSFPGYTCATLYQPGTLVLVESDEEPLQAGD
jgi:hypothetical protein